MTILEIIEQCKEFLTEYTIDEYRRKGMPEPSPSPLVFKCLDGLMMMTNGVDDGIWFIVQHFPESNTFSVLPVHIDEMVSGFKDENGKWIIGKKDDNNESDNRRNNI